jgi:RHS repeat-associated protein
MCLSCKHETTVDLREISIEKFLAEYDIYGTCLRDYIYMGGRLIAEYKPQEGKYYYYTSDQINSTRIVTNDSGTVVYSAAHDPYGGVQKTWENTYNATLKFSGKERDTESGLDYFGARYYDKAQYRFISVDPVTTSSGVIDDPQLWNLYSYCRNNPITFLDPDGKDPITITITRTSYGPEGVYGHYSVDNALFGQTLELPWRDNIKDISCIREGTYNASIHYWEKKSVWVVWLEDKYGRKGVFLHGGSKLKDTKGCILIGKEWDSKGGGLMDGPAAQQQMINYYVAHTFFDWPQFPEITVIIMHSEVTYSWHYGPATIFELLFSFGFPLIPWF